MTTKEFDALELFTQKIEELNDSIITTTKTPIINQRNDEIVAFDVRCSIEGYYEESVTIIYENLVENTSEELERLDDLYNRVNEN